MMNISGMRHVRLDNSTLMPNMGITKCSQKYDVMGLTIAIITLIAMVIDGDHVMVRDVIYCSRFFQNWHSPELFIVHH